ncbi:sulfite exporter TauE/SafE family protein [Parasediminibacterium paludis]|uniref:Probable membrane transporter protein n=1 Tax=Parasediminibacterium paludis TaxID=908966 RepID=A0ABV8PVB1_9BACT
MTITTIIILLIIGLVAGMLSGMVGVGGGIVIVPALVYFLAFSQKSAQGTSLGILLLPVGILAVTEYYKQGHIDVKVVLMVSAGFLIGGFFGSKLAIVLPEQTLKKIFALMLILTAIKMLFIDRDKPNEKQVNKTTTEIITEKK